MCGQWSLEFLVFEPNRAVNWPVTSIGNMVLHFWLYDFFFCLQTSSVACHRRKCFSSLSQTFESLKLVSALGEFGSHESQRVQFGEVSLC